MRRTTAIVAITLALILGYAWGYAHYAESYRAAERDADVALAICAKSYHDHMLTMHPDADDVAAGWREVEMAARGQSYFPPPPPWVEVADTSDAATDTVEEILPLTSGFTSCYAQSGGKVYCRP